MEFKYGKSADPFVTNEKFFLKLFNNTCDVRSQIVLYATQQQAYQFRSSIFSVGIFGTVARIFRWDRSGCQVTEPIDYSADKGNRQLAEFFLRLDRLADNPEARGWDPTIKVATANEVKDFMKAVQDVLETESKPDPNGTGGQNRVAQDKTLNPMFSKLVETVGDPGQYLRRKVTILDGDTKQYIVGRPTSILKSPTGRATRGFVGMSVDMKRLVFLKDSWRPDLDGIEAEDHWYKLLQKQKECPGKKKIGAYSHGSDVYATKKFIKCPDRRQRTITHLYAKDHGRVDLMMGYIHH